MKRYEVQIRHPAYGWTTAGNWPARTKSERLQSLEDCANGLGGNGSPYAHRLVQLVAVPIAIRGARRKTKAVPVLTEEK